MGDQRLDRVTHDAANAGNNTLLEEQLRQEPQYQLESQSWSTSCTRARCWRTAMHQPCWD
eukprot:11299784-Prorocentrum_lima.AAC.1